MTNRADLPQATGTITPASWRRQSRTTALEVLGGLSFGAAVHGAIVFVRWMF